MGAANKLNLGLVTGSGEEVSTSAGAGGPPAGPLGPIGMEGTGKGKAAKGVGQSGQAGQASQAPKVPQNGAPEAARRADSLEAQQAKKPEASLDAESIFSVDDFEAAEAEAEDEASSPDTGLEEAGGGRAERRIRDLSSRLKTSQAEVQRAQQAAQQAQQSAQMLQRQMSQQFQQFRQELMQLRQPQTPKSESELAVEKFRADTRSEVLKSPEVQGLLNKVKAMEQGLQKQQQEAKQASVRARMDADAAAAIQAVLPQGFPEEILTKKITFPGDKYSVDFRTWLERKAIAESYMSGGIPIDEAARRMIPYLKLFGLGLLKAGRQGEKVSAGRKAINTGRGARSATTTEGPQGLPTKDEARKAGFKDRLEAQMHTGGLVTRK